MFAMVAPAGAAAPAAVVKPHVDADADVDHLQGAFDVAAPFCLRFLVIRATGFPAGVAARLLAAAMHLFRFLFQRQRNGRPIQLLALVGDVDVRLVDKCKCASDQAIAPAAATITNNLRILLSRSRNSWPESDRDALTQRQIEPRFPRRAVSA